jgi:hypothetical protein
MTLDISDFHLNNPMERYEYLHITLAANPTCSMEEYKLEPLIHNGFIAVELRQGIYGLPQAGTVVNILSSSPCVWKTLESSMREERMQST